MHRYASHLSLFILLIAGVSFADSHDGLPTGSQDGLPPNSKRYERPTAPGSVGESIVATDDELKDWTDRFKRKSEVTFALYLLATRTAKAKDLSGDELKKTPEKLLELTQILKELPVASPELEPAQIEAARRIAVKNLLAPLQPVVNTLGAYANEQGALNVRRLLVDLGLSKNLQGIDTAKARAYEITIYGELDDHLGSDGKVPLKPIKTSSPGPEQKPTPTPTRDTSALPAASPPTGGTGTGNDASPPLATGAGSPPAEPGIVPVPGQPFTGQGDPNVQFNGAGTGAGNGTATGTGSGRGAANSSPPGSGGSPPSGGSSSSGGSGSQPPGGGNGGAPSYSSKNKGTQMGDPSKPVQLTQQELPQGPPAPQLPEGLNPRPPQTDRTDITDMEKSIGDRTTAAIQALSAGVQGAIAALRRKTNGLDTNSVAKETYSTKVQSFVSGPRNGSTDTSTPRARTPIAARRSSSPYSPPPYRAFRKAPVTPQN